MAFIRYPRMSGLTASMREVDRMRREMDRMFAGLVGGPSEAGRSGVFPPLNLTEDENKVYATAEIPGIRPEDIDITVVGNTLTLRGERRSDSAENVSYHRRERRSGSFHKAITLPGDINAEAVTAECKDGVLRLVLPKAESAKPKKIAVKAD